ncbi:MAG: phosphoribosylglycinamide formyltransferase [Gordonia amarae]
MSGRTARIVVLASGAGSLLASLIERSRKPGSVFEIVAVGVDRDCAAVTIARDAGIASFTCRVADHPDRAAWDGALHDLTEQAAPDWVVTAGFMKILGPRFLGRFGGHIVNSHPALLPSFPGAHGVADALAHGVKVTGTTVHLVDDGVDTGPILAQRAVAIADDDTEDALHERIKIIERELLADMVTALVAKGVVIEGRKARIP